MGGGGRFEVKGCLKASDPSGLSSSPSFPLDGILVFRRIFGFDLFDNTRFVFLS